MNAPVVWLLSDGAPGHLSQSRGIVDALQSVTPARTVIVPLKVRSSAWKRLGRFCLPWIRDPDFWLSRVYDLTLPEGRPYLLVSSGANTLLASALLARRTGAANVYSGTLKGYDPRAYDCVFTVTALGIPSNHVLPLPPVPGELARPFPPAGGDRCLAVLIGGDGAGYQYSAEDWRTLGSSLTELARRHDARLLLTTSRRTGAEAENLLHAAIPPECLADAVWWSRSPRPVVRDFLAAASGVVVTEDSLTMVAESIYSGRPVAAVRPATARPNANDEGALQAYAERGLLQRCGVDGLRTLSLPARPAAIPDVTAEIAAVVLPLLSKAAR